MKKIISIIGTRPQIIKHAALEPVLHKYFEVLTIHTGQHFEENMSGIFFDQLNIHPANFHLEVGRSFNFHGSQADKMSEGIDDILERERPDAVLVYGDSNTTLAGALAAEKQNIPIVHVEAGLRSFDLESAQELNRVLTDQLATFLFCPTQNALESLNNEGITDHVYWVGDLHADMIFQYRSELKKLPNQGQFYLCTLHLSENTNSADRLIWILETLDDLEQMVIFPMHPRTRQLCENFEINLLDFSNVLVLEPVSYLELLELLNNASAVITDSGGIQREAYLLQKKCATLRTQTEWTATLEGDWNTLVFENLEDLQSILEETPTEDFYQKNILGEGNAAQKIAEILNKNIC